jgi:acylaminoacyl-peptidase
VLRWGPAGAEGEPRCALPVVDTPASAGAWPGWFTAGPLARAPWVSDTELVVCSTWGSGDALVLVDTSAGRVRRLSPPLDQAGQWQLLDVREGVVAAAASTPAEPPYVAVAAAPDWAWRRVQHATAEPFGAAVDAALTSLEWRIVDVPLPGRAAGVPAEVEAVLLRSAPAAGSARLPPVLLVPHGGPHSACVAGFSMPLAFLAAQGYAVLQVNYRASTGFGLAALESSLGRAGQQDVQDCLTALDAAIAAQLVDGTRVAVIGGSHGGFLAAHLIGQAPERFACAALRNPGACPRNEYRARARVHETLTCAIHSAAAVTDVATMVGVSDIPDWCFVETAGLGISAYTEVPTAELLAAMRSISPIAHIEAVRAPVLMLLGAKDRRVPPSNGMAYAHALRQYGKAVRVLVFPEDEHPLSKPRTELESYINIVDWLRTFMPPRA